MKTVLLTLNAKYIHSSLALRSLSANCEGCELLEFTINNRKEQIMSAVYEARPDVLGLSCYIWNVDMLLDIADDIKKVLPNTKIIFGGPEAEHSPEYILGRGGADVVVLGEGEAVFRELLERRCKDLNEVPGLAYKDGAEIKYTAKPQRLDLNALKFPYKNEQDELGLGNRIIYYETSRGCPYRCQYCLSSVGEGMSFLDITRVYEQLDFFLSQNIKQVKLVDRTFNCSKMRAMSIWKYLIEHDNGVTNFHFEISAGLLDEDMLGLLRTARRGLFQFEIGVQSTNEQTLKEIQRNNDIDRLFENVRAIKLMGNIHQHLDLIVGLPYEDFASFKNSFNMVYSLRPEQLQMGFLKLLKGSGLREAADKYKIIYSSKASYEVMSTAWLGYGEILRLKLAEEMLDRFYNSGLFTYSLNYIIDFFDSPFDFFDTLGQYWKRTGKHEVSHSKQQIYFMLNEFIKEHVSDQAEVFCELLRFDLVLNENPKAMPSWMNADRIKMPTGFGRSELRLERFKFTVARETVEEEENYILFDYRNPESNPLLTKIHCTFKETQCAGGTCFASE